MTKNQKLWQNEIKRINRIIESAIKRGYKFKSDVVPERPKRITSKAIDDLKLLKTKTILAKAVYEDPVTKETFSGSDGYKIEQHRKKTNFKLTNQHTKTATPNVRKPPTSKRKAERKNENHVPSLSVNIVASVRNFIVQHLSENLRDERYAMLNTALNMLDMAVSRDGEKVVATRLSNEEGHIFDMIEKVAYYDLSSQEEAEELLQELITIINGGSLTPYDAESLSMYG